MRQLWLKFKDENGDEQRNAVEIELFTVGRHSANDLTVSDSRLSREHVRIESVDGEFYVSDSGSSNGTELNELKLNGQAKLKNGDLLNLGGGLRITIEIEEMAGEHDAAPPETAAEMPAPVASPPTYAPAASATASEGIPTSFFIIAPLLGLLVLVFIGGLIFLFSKGDKTPEISDTGDDYYSTGNDDDEKPAKNDDDDQPVKPVKSSTPVTTGTPANGGPITTSSPVPSGTDLPTTNFGETAKVEQNGALFLRRIAQNDPKAFLTGDQAQKVNAKVKQIGKSGALAENINAARKNAAQIKSLAASKNLKPQFLAVAAITKLGSGRGDIMQAAESVADIYDKLSTQIGSEFGEDSLLMVAAFDQGAAGDTMKMRNMLQDLATKSTEGARTIRTIWFLQKNGKISQSEFDRALNFLAIGTITQNPKEFGVKAEALML
jgi:hypothetical protein